MTRNILVFTSSTGKFYKKFESIKEASEKTNVNKSSITKCAKKKLNQCNGFIFRYEEEMRNFN